MSLSSGVDNFAHGWCRVAEITTIHRVTRTRLTTQIGAMLRHQRELHGLTQRQLAAQVGMSQAALARIEQGGRAVGLPTFERLFAALDRQLRVELETLDAHVDEALAASAALTLGERIAELRATELADSLAGIPFIFTGPTAAVLQGVPLPYGDVHLTMSWDAADDFTVWLERNYGRRWSDAWEEFGYLHLDPREPGPHRWSALLGTLTVRFTDRLPEYVEVCHDDRVYPCVPLIEIELDDPRTAELLERYRALASPAPSR